MHIFDMRRDRLFVVFMHAVLTSSSIKAARSLAGLSRSEVAAELNVSLVTVANVELGANLSASLDRKFRDLFESWEVEIFGWIDVRSETAFGEGVRWRGTPPARLRDSTFWPDRDIQSYQIRAARSLLGLSALEVASAIGASRNSVRQLEGGRPHQRHTNTRLRDFFESSGLEFLGVVDIAARTLRGGGVSKKIPHDAPPDILAAAVSR